MRINPGVVLLCLLAAAPVRAQDVTQKGFADFKAVAYPQTTTVDPTQLVGEALLRYEVSARPAGWLKLDGGIDGRADTHDQTAWDGLDWSDRTVQRPALGVRRLNAIVSRGLVTFSVGKQFVRWGKTDTMNPTDRFAPRDFLAVFDNEYLAVTSARLTAGPQSDTIDLVVSRFTPSRIPLLDQRWSGTASTVPALPVLDQGAVYPAQGQFGARWNHVGPGYEFSISGFSGNNHMPAIASQVVPPNPVAGAHVDLLRTYPAIWMAGADAAVPLDWFTAKGEVACIASRDGRSDDYVIYVVQAERQFGELFVVLGYAGEVITAERAPSGFAFDRALTRSLLGRASYTIDTTRSATLDGALRQDLEGSWLRGEYSQATGAHLRLTLQGSWIRGSGNDFFGRYNRNSSLMASVRYSY